MGTVTQPVRTDSLIRIKPDQVLCMADCCGQVADFVLRRFHTAGDTAKLAYCEHHARQVAMELAIRMPDEWPNARSEHFFTGALRCPRHCNP
jgi:hypothetical protein